MDKTREEFNCDLFVSMGLDKCLDFLQEGKTEQYNPDEDEVCFSLDSIQKTINKAKESENGLNDFVYLLTTSCLSRIIKPTRNRSLKYFEENTEEQPISDAEVHYSLSSIKKVVQQALNVSNGLDDLILMLKTSCLSRIPKSRGSRRSGKTRCKREPVTRDELLSACQLIDKETRKQPKASNKRKSPSMSDDSEQESQRKKLDN